MGARIRIGTFNLENLGLSAKPGPSIEERVAALRPLLERMNADVLCLQEANADEKPDRTRALTALDRLIADTAYQGFHRKVTRNDAGTRFRDVHNLVTLSRFPIVSSRQIHHDFVPPPRHRLVTAEPHADAPSDVIWDRPFLHVEIDLLGRRLDVLNLHLRAPLSSFIPGRKQSAFVWSSVAAWAEGYFVASMKRTGQAFEARLLVDRLFDGDESAFVAVCGDLNADLNETPLTTLRGDPEDTGNAALAPRALKPLEAGLPEPIRFTVRHSGRRLMLDHILVSRALAARFLGIEVYNEFLVDEAAAFAAGRPEPGSFHAPLVASFELD